MGYDRGDSFPLDFEPNGDPFGSEYRKEKENIEIFPIRISKGKPSPRSYPIQCERKGKYSFLNVDLFSHRPWERETPLGLMCGP